MSTFTDKEIDDYLMGRLSAERARALEQRAAADHDLQKRINMEQLIKLGAERFGRERFKNRVKILVERRKQKRRWLYVVVALIILVLGAYYYTMQKGASGDTVIQPDVIYAQYFEAPQLISPSRSGDSETDLASQKLVMRQAYAERQWGEIISLRLNNGWKQDAEMALIRMIALLETGEPRQALNISKEVTVKDIRFSDHIEWYAALAELKLGNLESVKDLLNDIISNDDHDHYDEAVSLLDKL
ncbi:MAG: hypothetical protein R3275_12750 [Saprospiraceae bacterium]|nr:hypothetical protein [Saprospiraceae bacterium]